MDNLLEVEHGVSVEFVPYPNFLRDDSLREVNPFTPHLTADVKNAIIEEAKTNAPYYYWICFKSSVEDRTSTAGRLIITALKLPNGE